MNDCDLELQHVDGILEVTGKLDEDELPEVSASNLLFKNFEEVSKNSIQNENITYLENAVDDSDTRIEIQLGPQHFDLLKLIGQGAFGFYFYFMQCSQ
jgi:hypothetical protein